MERTRRRTITLYALRAGWPFALRETLRMSVLDLRTGPPPRWSDAVAGILWLPRFAAKVRAYDAGMLGTYLLGQSPVDDEFLAAAGLDYAGFIAIVRAVPDDAAVIDAIERRSPGASARLREWSRQMPIARALHMRVLDLDDGYTSPGPWGRLFRLGNAVFVPLVALIRRLRPLRP
jgi:Domain of unknown function (DUF5069)